jgi:hypothetical protein
VLFLIHREWTGDINNIAKDSTGGSNKYLFSLQQPPSPVVYEEMVANLQILGAGRGGDFRIGGARR